VLASCDCPAKPDDRLPSGTAGWEIFGRDFRKPYDSIAYWFIERTEEKLLANKQIFLRRRL
jgi:hypothetical protein